jgi:ribosomal protein L19E
LNFISKIVNIRVGLREAKDQLVIDEKHIIELTRISKGVNALDDKVGINFVD